MHIALLRPAGDTSDVRQAVTCSLLSVLFLCRSQRKVILSSILCASQHGPGLRCLPCQAFTHPPKPETTDAQKQAQGACSKTLSTCYTRAACRVDGAVPPHCCLQGSNVRSADELLLYRMERGTETGARMFSISCQLLSSDDSA